MATTFVWKGRSPNGELLSGEYQAENKEDLVSHLRKRKIIITSMREKAKGNWALKMPGMDRVRSEERRVGKECMVQCRSRWSPYH